MNPRTRAIYQYVSVSGTGKRQSGFGAFLPNEDIDTRDKCSVVVTNNVDRAERRDCEGVDLIGEPINSRDVTITLTYDEGFTPQQATRWTAYHQGIAAAPTGATVNEIQTVTASGADPVTLSLAHEGKTGTTNPIPVGATLAEIKEALLRKTGSANAMGKLLKDGDFTLSGNLTDGLIITFTGRMAAANLPLMTAVNAGVVQTTAGDQRLHAISRSTDGSLPLFSLITGDKNGDYKSFKFGDAVVDLITFDSRAGAGALVTMAVTIFANYSAEKLDDYVVPECANIIPLKVTDCKVKINGTFETSDLESLTATLSNAVPREAAFGYDDFDISTPYQRGDTPSQGFSLSVFATPDHPLYERAAAEETEGNEVEFILYLGHTGNRVALTAPAAKLKLQGTPLGFAGPLRQSTINLDVTPYNSPPLTYSANINQAAAFLAAAG